MDELRRTVVSSHYVWNVHPRPRRRGQREDRYDPLLEWKQDTRYLKYEPPPPDSLWLLPETLDTKAEAPEPDHAAHRVGPETWDSSSSQTVPQT